METLIGATEDDIARQCKLVSTYLGVLLPQEMTLWEFYYELDLILKPKPKKKKQEIE